MDEPVMHYVDVAELVEGAWDQYMACKDVSTNNKEFENISKDVVFLHIALRETEAGLGETFYLSHTRNDKLAELIVAIQNALQDLGKVLDDYEKLPVQAQRTLDRGHWNADSLSKAREGIKSNTTLLSAFNHGLSANSRVRIIKRLNKFMQEFRAGLRESSVMSDSSSLAETIDSDSVWEQLKVELEDIGISESALKEDQAFIKDFLKGEIKSGRLEEDNPDWRPPAPSIADSGYGSSRYDAASMRTYETSIFNSQSWTRSRTASQTPSWNSRWRPNWAPTVNEMTTANKEFAESIAESRTNSERSKASSLESIKVRKASTVSTYVFKLMRKDTEIIEAASDGNIKKVAKLISKGANVNARDRWGWTALSMCGYGGFPDIARLLMEHGADLDNVDVDGDTPELLARNRGHHEMLVLFDEERLRRKAKEDKEAEAKREKLRMGRNDSGFESLKRSTS